LSVESTITLPLSSSGSPKRPTNGVAFTPAVQNQRDGLDALAVGERRCLRVEGVKSRADSDVHSTFRQLARRVVAELLRDLREDLRRRVDEHPALLDLT
jgi:hypothetical protein